MKLASLLNKKLIKCNMKAKAKEEALGELVDHLVENSDLDRRDEILSAVLERESLGSTARGKSAAFPHARCDVVDDFYIVIGTSKEGVDFGADEKVHFIALLLITKASSSLYLQTIAAFASLAMQKEHFAALIAADNPDEIVGYIDQTGVEVRRTLQAKDIMSPVEHVLSPGMTVKEALDLFFKHGIGSAPVLDEKGDFIGRLSEMEILRIGIPDYISKLGDVSFMSDSEPFERLLKSEAEILVGDVMATALPTTEPEATIIHVASTMVNRPVRLMYVLESKKVVGVIHCGDFIKKIIRG